MWRRTWSSPNTTRTNCTSAEHAAGLRPAAHGSTAPKPAEETEDKAFVRCGARVLRRTLKVWGTRPGPQGAEEELCTRGAAGADGWHEYEHDPGARIAVVLADRGCPVRDVRGRT